MDSGIYIKPWASGTWASWVSPPGGGTTIDTPACAYLTSILYVVVRGGGNELYWNSYFGASQSWSGWVDLNGASSSAPVLVSIPSLSRIDLFVHGTDNGIYHKAYTSGSWSSSWDSPGGATPSRPAAAFYFNHECLNSGCVNSIDSDYLLLVVRGMDNNVYSYSYAIAGVVSGWSSLGGATSSAPTLAFDANACSSASTATCSSMIGLAVQGTDNALYYNIFSAGGWSGWSGLGGSISNSPAVAYIPGTACTSPPCLCTCDFTLLVEGNPSNNLYGNNASVSPGCPLCVAAWGTVPSGTPGQTSSDPALTSVV